MVLATLVGVLFVLELCGRLSVVSVSGSIDDCPRPSHFSVTDEVEALWELDVAVYGTKVIEVDLEVVCYLSAHLQCVFLTVSL